MRVYALQVSCADVSATFRPLFSSAFQGFIQNEVFASSYRFVKRLLLVVIIRPERKVVNAQIFPVTGIPDTRAQRWGAFRRVSRLTRMRPRLTIPNSGYCFINRPMSAGR
jgi:hypothetical protein